MPKQMDELGLEFSPFICWRANSSNTANLVR